MKKLLKYVTPHLCLWALFIGIFSICLTGFFSNNQEAFSVLDSTDCLLREAYVEEENLNLYYDVMNLIEDELKANNTSVIEQLQTQVDEYQDMLVNNTYNDKENVQTLIKLNNEMIKSYRSYQNSKLTRKADNPTYTPVVTAAIAYFKSKKYYLSAELLSFALENEELDAQYNIQRTDIIEKSTKFQKLAFDTKTKGGDSFEKTGNTIDDDLYYAIHKFSFEKQIPTSRTVTIQDRYDFAHIENPQGALEIILNTMYEAQEAGVLVPFQINETISLTTQINLQEQDSFEETFDIAIGEERYFVVNVPNSANLHMQIIDSNYSTMIKACCISDDSQDSSISTPVTFNFAIGSAPLVSNINTVTVRFSCK